MAGFRIPGPVCGSLGSALDDGTSALWWMPPPGPMSRPPPARRWYRESRRGGFAAGSLTMSPEAVALLKAIETLRLMPYDDQTGRATTVWVRGATIGYGHLIPRSDWATYSGGITQARADALFLADAAPYEQLVGDTIRVGLQQYEFDALVILAFNLGPNQFPTSTVVALINQPDSDPARQLAALEVAWKAWNKSQRRVNRGLINRRAAEWRIYTTGVYARW